MKTMRESFVEKMNMPSFQAPMGVSANSNWSPEKHHFQGLVLQQLTENPTLQAFVQVTFDRFNTIDGITQGIQFYANRIEQLEKQVEILKELLFERDEAQRDARIPSRMIPLAKEAPNFSKQSEAAAEMESLREFEGDRP